MPCTRWHTCSLVVQLCAGLRALRGRRVSCFSFYALKGCSWGPLMQSVVKPGPKWTQQQSLAENPLWLLVRTVHSEWVGRQKQLMSQSAIWIQNNWPLCKCFELRINWPPENAAFWRTFEGCGFAFCLGKQRRFKRTKRSFMWNKTYQHMPDLLTLKTNVVNIRHFGQKSKKWHFVPQKTPSNIIKYEAKYIKYIYNEIFRRTLAMVSLKTKRFALMYQQIPLL